MDWSSAWRHHWAQWAQGRRKSTSVPPPHPRSCTRRGAGRARQRNRMQDAPASGSAIAVDWKAPGAILLIYVLSLATSQWPGRADGAASRPRLSTRRARHLDRPARSERCSRRWKPSESLCRCTPRCGWALPRPLRFGSSTRIVCISAFYGLYASFEFGHLVRGQRRLNRRWSIITPLADWIEGLAAGSWQPPEGVTRRGSPAPNLSRPPRSVPLAKACQLLDATRSSSIRAGASKLATSRPPWAVFIAVCTARRPGVERTLRCRRPE